MAEKETLLTDAQIDKLTVAGLKQELDKRGVEYEKKDLKATLAAKLKESCNNNNNNKAAAPTATTEEKEEEGKEEAATTKAKKRKAASEEPKEQKEEEEEQEKKKGVSIAKRTKKKSKKEEEEEEEKKEFSDDDDDDDDDDDNDKEEEKKGEDDDDISKLESLVPDAANPENCTMTVYIRGNEGRLIGKKGETLKYIEARFRCSIKIDRENGTCAVKGPTSEMEECKKIIQEVCEIGSIADRHPASNIQQGAVLKEHETLNGISAANVNPYSIDEDSLPDELRGIPNDQEVAIEIPCPGKEGRVIGRGGATIRDIERVSGANLKVVKGSGICNVNGKRIDVIRARQVVLETMALETDTFGMQKMQNQQQQQQMMMTPSQYAAMQMGGGAGGGVYGGYYGASVYGQQQPQGGGGGGGGGSNINPIVPDGQTRIVIPTQGHEGRIIGKGGAHIKLLRDRTGCDIQMDRSKQPVTCVITGTAANVKECERLVYEAIEKANQTFGPNGSKMFAQQQQQQYGMAYGQQAAPVNVYGAAPQTAQVYGAAAAPVNVYGAAATQQQPQQQQLMQQYQQYYQQQQVYAAPQQQEYDPSQPQAAAAAAASDWATYYSEGKPYYYNSKTGETKWA